MERTNLMENYDLDIMFEGDYVYYYEMRGIEIFQLREMFKSNNFTQ